MLGPIEFLVDKATTDRIAPDSALRFNKRIKLFFLFRPHDHDHLPAFQLGKLLDGGVFFQVGFDALQQIHAQFAVRHFPAFKTHGNFGFVAIVEEFDQIAQFDLVVTFLGARPEFDFLDLDLLLLLLGGLQFFILFKLVFAVIHDFTNRRIGIGRYFDQIHVCIIGKL